MVSIDAYVLAEQKSTDANYAHDFVGTTRRLINLWCNFKGKLLRLWPITSWWVVSANGDCYHFCLQDKHRHSSLAGASLHTWHDILCICMQLISSCSFLLVKKQEFEKVFFSPENQEWGAFSRPSEKKYRSCLTTIDSSRGTQNAKFTMSILWKRNSRDPKECMYVQHVYICKRDERKIRKKERVKDWKEENECLALSNHGAKPESEGSFTNDRRRGPTLPTRVAVPGRSVVTF